MLYLKKNKMSVSKKNEVYAYSHGLRCFLPYFVGLAYQGKDIVFRFIIECSSLRDFGP